MKFVKTIKSAVALLASAALLAGCGSPAPKASEQPAPTGSEQPAQTGNTNTGAVKELKLAHNLSEQHTVHLAIQEFAKLIESKSNGSLKVTIYPNGQLGSESEVLEQLQAGSVAMTKVSANSLITYEEGYNAFSLPYVFDNAEHFYKSMDSDAVKEMYGATKEKGFIGLTYYTSGARSFYTKNKEILAPADLKGLKIRVQDSPSQVDMIKAMGGTPVTMPYGDVYTSLQSGVIDGAESNETALTVGKHGEVAKFFSYDEHTRIPDILVISSKVWDSLTPEEQQVVQDAAKESTELHKPMWDNAIEESKKEASEKMNVKFIEVDKVPFQEATKAMRDDYASKMPTVKSLLDAFEQLK